MFEIDEAMCEVNEVFDVEANEVMDVVVDNEEVHSFGHNTWKLKKIINSMS